MSAAQVVREDMVSTEIPKNYTASPSSFVGTPHLTINRDATYELEESTHFEGNCHLSKKDKAKTDPDKVPRSC